MEYQKYLELFKKKISDLSRAQWAGVIFVAIIALGAAVYFIDPQKKLLERRNSQRRSDVVNILNAVYKYSVDNETLPDSITTTPTMICKSGAQSCDGLVDISEIIKKEEKLLSEVPVDPKSNDPNNSGYQIFKSPNGRINVSAPLAENNAVISLSK